MVSIKFSEWIGQQSRPSLALILLLLPGVSAILIATLIMNIFGVFRSAWSNIAIDIAPALIIGLFCLLSLTRLGFKMAFIVQGIIWILFLTFAAIQQGPDDLPYLWQPAGFAVIVWLTSFLITRFILQNADPKAVSRS